MISTTAKRQRGAALLALLGVIALGASWFVVSRLNAESNLAAATRATRNTEVLTKAKQALIGYVAAQAVKAGETRPGALPCPEAGADFNNAANEGTASYPCTLPKVGRFPWRTIGLQKLVDAHGEPLWYVVSPGWAGAGTVINSDSLGQLTVDGAANDSVALIIAPGPAFSVPAAPGCTAWNQVRSTVAPPDWRNYLECENATYPTPDAIFQTRGPAGSFNDQVVRITVAEIMPAIEAAIANRIEREIVPALNTVITPAAWGFAGTKPMYPYAAAFASPGPGAGTSNYRGAAGTYLGLLPFNQTQGCTESASDPRCTTATTGGTAFLVFSKPINDVQTAGSGSIRTQSNCAWQATTYVCTGEYLQPSISVTVTINVTNAAMGLRALDLSRITCSAVDDVGAGIPEQNVPCTTSVAIQTNGAASFTVATGPMPDIVDSGWGTYANYKISMQRAAIGDHALLDTTDATTGWFARNEWFRLTYYAVAAGHTAATLPPTCTTGTNCLTVANVTPAGAQRAILILGGGSMNGSARPSATLANYLEAGNATGAFTRNTVRTATAIPVAQRFNDLVIVIGSN